MHENKPGYNDWIIRVKDYLENGICRSLEKYLKIRTGTNRDILQTLSIINWNKDQLHLYTIVVSSSIIQ